MGQHLFRDKNERILNIEGRYATVLKEEDLSLFRHRYENDIKKSYLEHLSEFFSKVNDAGYFDQFNIEKHHDADEM